MGVRADVAGGSSVSCSRKKSQRGARALASKRKRQEGEKSREWAEGPEFKLDKKVRG